MGGVEYAGRSRVASRRRLVEANRRGVHEAVARAAAVFGRRVPRDDVAVGGEPAGWVGGARSEGVARDDDLDERERNERGMSRENGEKMREMRR